MYEFSVFLTYVQAFFDRWWRRQIPEVQQAVRKLVDKGQLEFVYEFSDDHLNDTVFYKTLDTGKFIAILLQKWRVVYAR